MFFAGFERFCFILVLAALGFFFLGIFLGALREPFFKGFTPFFTGLRFFPTFFFTDFFLTTISFNSFVRYYQ